MMYFALVQVDFGRRIPIQGLPVSICDPNAAPNGPEPLFQKLMPRAHSYAYGGWTEEGIGLKFRSPSKLRLAGSAMDTAFNSALV